jgi:hypothetical protein
MRTTIPLDEDFISKTQAYSGLDEKTALVCEALKGGCATLSRSLRQSCSPKAGQFAGRFHVTQFSKRLVIAAAMPGRCPIGISCAPSLPN